jgi:hypothetical protein
LADGSENKKKFRECTKHVGVKISYDPGDFDDCPLCNAEAKLDEYESSDS